MRKIRQVLRLAHEAGASQRRIAKSLGLSRDVVSDYLIRATAAGLAWPLPPELDDAQLEALLFPPLAVKAGRKPEPDWAVIHQEMKRKGHLAGTEYGVSGRAAGWDQLQPVLRPLPGMAPKPETLYAPDSRGRRTGVRRLRRADRGNTQSGDR